MKRAKISKLSKEKNKVSVRSGSSKNENHVHVLDELAGSANILETRKSDLGDNGTKLTACRGNTVRGGTVTSRERLTGYDERSRVGPEVLEEVGEAVEEYECLLSGGSGGEFVVSETHDNEEHGEDDEAHKLDWLTAPTVNEEEGSPVTGDETGDDEDEVTDSDVVEILVNGKGTSHVLARSAETNCGKNDGGVQSETVEGNLIIKMSVTLSDR